MPVTFPFTGSLRSGISGFFLSMFFLTVFLGLSYGQWKASFSERLEAGNFRGALEYLEKEAHLIEPRHRAFVTLAKGYCARQLGDKELESRWIEEFFDTHKGVSGLFPLSNKEMNRQIGNYFRSWYRMYPRVERMGLVENMAFKGSDVPSQLTLGVEVENGAQYRLLYRSQVVAGGLMQKGFNFVRVPTKGLFKGSANHPYRLELKVGKFTVGKNFKLNITCDLPGNSGQVKQEIRAAGYGVAMFIENRLIAYHKKASIGGVIR